MSSLPEKPGALTWQEGSTPPACALALVQRRVDASVISAVAGRGLPLTSEVAVMVYEAKARAAVASNEMKARK